MSPSPPHSPSDPPSSGPHGRSRRHHYSPRLGRQLVCALYHEARRCRLPMTRLADELLAAALRGSQGLRLAESQFPNAAVCERAG